MDIQTKQKLNSVNWDFSDYNSAKYPLDLNSIHWYLATFPPLIPMYLINLLSNEGDVVLDPFGGAGTTAIKAIELNRRFFYNDLNPFAVEIATAKADILRCFENDEYFLKDEDEIINALIHEEINIDKFIQANALDPNIKKWYEPETLRELCVILRFILNEITSNRTELSIRKCAFSSILKATCSQTDHITYITDNCFPKTLIYKDAKKLYLAQINTIRMSAADFYKRYLALFESKVSVIDNLNNSIINSGDSRNMDWLRNDSVDLVVTSPPYLCAQDYIKTMRLTNMFFPNEEMRKRLLLEIGARRKRGSNAEKTVGEYYEDMEKVIAEIARVLKPEKYFCLIIGQGSGKITKEFDTVSDISKLIQEKYGFSLEHTTKRSIWSRRIHVGGVSEESILIFKKVKTEAPENDI